MDISQDLDGEEPSPLLQAYLNIATGTYFISKMFQTFTDLDPEKCTPAFDGLIVNELILALDHHALGTRALRRLEYYRTMFGLCE